MTTSPEPEEHLRTAEAQRLCADAQRLENWKRWGPYLSERQWATVREDYSAWGNCWDYFPHDHARSRAYRWGEDGLLGICDREGRLCFALALWNGQDPILKERLFGVTGPEGNHGEDVKECYYYLDSTPTHSYMKALYKYPQRAYPYARLVEENRRRGLLDREFELEDTCIFDEERYFDVQAEYAKDGPNDLLIRITVFNRGPEAARLDVIPTLWFRNMWSWDCTHEGCGIRPSLRLETANRIRAMHETLGEFSLSFETDLNGAAVEPLFTHNETNHQRLFGTANPSPWVKDAFHERIVHGRLDAVNPQRTGTKSGLWFQLTLQPGESRTLRLRLSDVAPEVGSDFDAVFARRQAEADEYYGSLLPAAMDDDARNVARQAYAGLLWTKQFYHYVVEAWLKGDPGQPPPPAQRWAGRNHEWDHVFSRDVISMPDKWEYPWFAAWDLAFHMVPMAKVDPVYAKQQLILFLREWFMHPNGQMPAYEFAFSDVNPPVHAWAAWRVYKITGSRGLRDRPFLESVFQKLLLNFTWWVNRKDMDGNNIFSGGFLGLDNIGVFDRSKPLPTGGFLQQADGTAWMAFYCLTMLSMAIELAQENPVYEDLASKFFEHFVEIAHAMNTLGGSGLWHEADGFYYDHLRVEGQSRPLLTRSLVGLMPLIAVEVLEESKVRRLPGFSKRMDWFLEHKRDLTVINTCQTCAHKEHRLLAIPNRTRLSRALAYMFHEDEFLSPYGLRSLSKVHGAHPYIFRHDGTEHRVDYVPGESTTHLFGGNSNWRGPIWFPINFLLVEALERFHHFYGDSFQVEVPTGSGRWMTLQQASDLLSRRLAGLFLRDPSGNRPCHAELRRYSSDPHWRDLVLFHEYFHGETGRGLGASHQTGWTALVTKLLEDTAG